MTDIAIRRLHLRRRLLSAMTALALAAPAHAATTSTTHMIQSSADADVRLHVRERAPAGDAAANGEAVLFVHGATYPGHTFDTALADGPSWMARLAEAGYRVYAMDQRGYGRSTRPAAMQAPAEDNPPFARAEDVISDMGDVIDFIRKDSGDERVDLVGWSWGTVTGGMFTARHGDRIDRLVLYAPVYRHDNPAWTEKLADPEAPSKLADVGAYRTVTRTQADERWAAQIDADDPAAWRDPAVFSRWYDAMIDMAPGEAEDDVIKAPNGVLVDLWEIFNGRAVYDASKIEVPTLVIRGDDDPTATDADARGLYAALGASIKRYVVIGDGTHFLNLEKHAPQLYAETLLFLDGD